MFRFMCLLVNRPGTAKRQAMEQGWTPSVSAGDRRRTKELSLGRPLRSSFVMTPPMSTVLGYRLTVQTHRDSHHELERGKCELKEDAATFASTESTGNGTPIPYLVNPQSDMTPLSHAHQTVKRAIGFNHRTDFWGTDASSPTHQRPTASECRRRTFLQADDHCTVASSEASSVTLTAVPADPETTECLRQWALASHPGMSAAEEKEAEKREDDVVEHMDDSAEPKNGQGGDAADGENKDGGSGAMD